MEGSMEGKSDGIVEGASECSIKEEDAVGLSEDIVGASEGISEGISEGALEGD